MYVHVLRSNPVPDATYACADLRGSYVLNSGIASLEDADAVLLLGSN
eukprot:COSAG01_NODE_6141_length_3825_cov_12.238734_1_plen_46_part_10